MIQYERVKIRGRGGMRRTELKNLFISTYKVILSIYDVLAQNPSLQFPLWVSCYRTIRLDLLKILNLQKRSLSNLQIHIHSEQF